jgi:hypothetical protein
MIVGLNTLWYVGLQPFFFLSYYLLEFDEFFFQETYICQLKDRYGDDPATHLDINSDLWLEAGLSGGLVRNPVYGLFNTTAENLRTTRSVSTIGCSQSILST